MTGSKLRATVATISEVKEILAVVVVAELSEYRVHHSANEAFAQVADGNACTLLEEHLTTVALTFREYSEAFTLRDNRLFTDESSYIVNIGDVEVILGSVGVGKRIVA